MSKLRIEFDTNNAAFANNWGGEVARILGRLASHLSERQADPATVHGGLLDSNGNVIGQWSVLDD